MTAVPAVALSVAGSDSGGGAGIQADLKTFTALDTWGTTALTAITAQNTRGVRRSYVLPAEEVVAQIRAVAEDFTLGAAKTGMLGTAEVVTAVAGELAGLGVPVVVDPVLVTSHGELLLEPVAVAALRELLLPGAAVVTPNVPEAEALTGRTIRGPDGMRAAAEALGALGAPAVLLKGGHLRGARAADLLWRDGDECWLDAERLDARHTHGTGCTLSAALCAGLARGESLEDACRAAKGFVTEAIRAALPLGAGIGPVNPAWRQRRD